MAPARGTQRGQLRAGQPGLSGQLGETVEGPVAVGHRRQRPYDPVRVVRTAVAAAHRGGEGGTDGDQRSRRRAVTRFGGTMEQRHLVVGLQAPRCVVRVDLSHTDHAQVGQLGGTQGSHAGRAEDSDSPGHDREDLLVPDRADLVEVAVDDSHRVPLPQRQPQQVAGGHRREHMDTRQCGQVRRGRAGEQVLLRHVHLVLRSVGPGRARGTPRGPRGRRGRGGCGPRRAGSSRSAR